MSYAPVARFSPVPPSQGWDVRIVLGVREGDPDVVGELYGRYRARVYHFALSRLRDHHDAEDLTQETFIRAIQNIQSFRGQSRLLTWIFGIANLLVLEQSRNKHDRIPRASDDELATLPAPSLSEGWIERRTDAARLLRRCSFVLEHNVTPQQQRIFQLMIEENASLRTISHEVGIGIGAVKSSLRNTRRILNQRTRTSRV